MAEADAIIVARAERDFDEGLAHARERIRATHGRLGGATLDALLMAAVRALGVRDRLAHDVRDLLALAHRVAKGEDPRALAEAHVDRVLRMKQGMHLVAREDDPAFASVRASAIDLFAFRLPDLACMAQVDSPRDYDDLVRRAFPERAYVDSMVEDNGARMHAIIDHLEQNPHVLRAPRGLVLKLAVTAREMISWKVAQVKAGVDEIYRAPTPRET